MNVQTLGQILKQRINQKVQILIMPPKRGRYLQSPNPIESVAGDSVVDESCIPNHQVEVVSHDDTHTSDSSASEPSCVRHKSIFSADVIVTADEPQICGSVGTPPESANDIPATDGPSNGVSVGTPPASPGKNRTAFLLQHSPSRLTCNLEISRCPIGSKVSLVAVVIASFPAYTNPDRRYIQLADATGSVGITVWNGNVSKFNRESIGKVVHCGKVVLGSHQGKKVLTMTRESTMELSPDSTLNAWWRSLALEAPIKLSCVADVEDNTIVNVSGILGLVSSEQKIVSSAERTLTTLHLTDQFGRFDVRSWNHVREDFVSHVDKPILITRVRITSFAGQKIGEILDNSASAIVNSFPGSKALAQYWCE
jgi:hypothetical protein